MVVGCVKMQDDYDYQEEEQGINRMSGNKCRDCGRLGCEGGTSCEIAAEQRADRIFERK